MNTVSLGQQGEKAAARYLQQNGYTLLEQNFRLPWGEIDLIAKEGDVLVFVEVKSWRVHTEDQLGYSINHSKKGKLVSLAKEYLRVHPEYAENPARFDVLFVQDDPGRIIHYKDAFTEGR
ncbi:MAG: YraN family protein [Spirochaetales bacterium]